MLAGIFGLEVSEMHPNKHLPRELVSQGVTRGLRGRETTTVRQERQDLSALLVNLLDGFDGI